MNTKMIRYILCRMLGVEAVLLMIPVIVAALYQEMSGIAFLIPAGILLLLFFLAGVKKPEQSHIYGKEGMVIVALAWILWSLFGAMPFTISGFIPNYMDAFFETVSGFTTTGSSILRDVEALPQCLLFWRSLTHWIGGMGVLVFLLSLLPLTGGYHMNLMKAESPGPSVSRLVPHIKDTAKILYGIYLAITLLEIVILCALGMPLFESLLTSFGTTGTGGFGFRNDSFASFSPAIQNTVTTFMILSGINYTFYFCILSRRIKDAFRIEEVRWYLFLIFASVGMITYNIRPLYANTMDALRNAFFQVGAIITTTGYSTADFDMWPALSQTILVTLMFVGACAGSTGGGIKSIPAGDFIQNHPQRAFPDYPPPRDPQDPHGRTCRRTQHPALYQCFSGHLLYFAHAVNAYHQPGRVRFYHELYSSRLVSEQHRSRLKPCRTGAEFFDLLAALQGCADF